MTDEKKKELIKEVSEPITRPIGKLQLLFLVTIFASVFVFIWGESSDGWKTLLSGLFGTFLLGLINYVWVKCVTKTINNNWKDIEAEFEKKKSNSKFHQRLAEMQKQKEGLK